MKAYVTSIGEPTTELCVEQLKKYGYEVVLLESDTSLWHKLSAIYFMAKDDFLRVDADMIPNARVKDFYEMYHKENVWWVQATIYDWYKQDTGHGGIQFIRKQALPHLREAIERFELAERPESQMFRLDAFENPRKCVTDPFITGLHGYGQPNLERVKAIKARRGQAWRYDWELVEELNQL